MFSRSIKLFDLFGFQIKVDPSWLLIAALIVWSLSIGYFPAAVTGLAPSAYLILAIAAMLGLFISLILHELSHSLVAQRFGLGIGSITLFLFGGVAELESEPEDAGSEFWIAVAGPAMSIALAAGFWLLGLLAGLAQAAPAAIALIVYLALINLVLGLFNLLPAFPLDGGRVYRAVLWNRTGDVVEATRRASGLAAGFAYALMIIGLMTLFAGGQIGGMWQILIGLYLLVISRTSYQQLLMKAALKARTVASMMTPAPWTVTPNQTLAEMVNQVMLRHAVSFVPVVEGKALLGYIDIHILKKIDRENWASTQVGDVFEGRAPQNVIAPDMATDDLLHRIGETGRRKFLVAEGDALVGVVSLSDLTAYMTILQQIGRPRAPRPPGRRHQA